MLGVEDYGSGSESESEQQETVEPKRPVAPKKSSLDLLPPTNNGASSRISLPPAKTHKKAPKKIAIEIPSLSKVDVETEKDDIDPERPPAKRARTGAGSSSLLSMLPEPKQKGPVAQPQERVLGGGKGPGLVFNANRSAAPTRVEEDHDETVNEEIESTAKPSMSSLPFLPPSLAKGRANISLEDERKGPPKPPLPTVSATPSADFFSLNNSNGSTSTSADSKTPSFSLPTLSAAPAIPTFEPPEPTPYDPYPGYYQLPSGSWAAYDPEYYKKFAKKWQQDYDAYVRGLEKGTMKGFEGYEENASEVDAMKEMERAKVEIKEREERKALTTGKSATGEPEQPKMKFTASKLSGIAKSRHQLSTLLKDAYENREALEERIAEARRNRKEAGNKYGF